MNKVFLFLIVALFLSGCATEQSAPLAPESGQLKEVTLNYKEGYNFREDKIYSGNFTEVFMKVDMLYGETGGGDNNMIEARSAIHDNGVVGLEQAEPFPKDSYESFLAPQDGHVYSLGFWSLKQDLEQDFRTMPSLAIKVISVSEDRITFQYDLKKVEEIISSIS